MHGQRKFVGGVVGFSPAREVWLGGEGKRMPAQVTVQLEGGQKGLLDTTSPRAVHWATMIEELHRKNRPVYLEIDDATGVITLLRVPRVYKVERLDPDEHGNLRVRLRATAAMRLLLRSDPKFDAMRASLEAAAADGSERLITETRDEHEIIDVRSPEGETGEGSEPAPPAPEDPPVSPARAREVFGHMAGESCDPTNPSATCIPFLYPDDGCWIRAHIMCHLMRTGGPNTTTNPPEDPEKVWINASTALVAPTVNHPDCQVVWGWHVAPTLMVTLPSGNEKQVVDPSLSPFPESEADWKSRQGDPGATLTETAWTDYNFAGDSRTVTLAQAQQYMQEYRDELRDRCLDIGPPPYRCTRTCFFIVDRSTFSDDEVGAMLAVASPAVVPDAFYVVVDGFSPFELGFTAATMQVTPTLNVSPGVSGMTLTPDRVEFEVPTHLNRRQRLTWVYRVSFADTTGFTSDVIPVTLQASISSVLGTGRIQLIRQPSPYEVDGQVSWLSTDLRVFQINAGQMKLGVTMGSDPSAFITQVLANLRTGNTAGQTFENDISVDQQTSRLELSTSVSGTAVYNFAVARVRYRSQVASATDVRVFFRLFPAATTSLEYSASTTYRRHTSGPREIPLLGLANGGVVAIPCFAAPRIPSATASMITQTDPPNVQTIPPDTTGAEVVRYFGCWLDINQDEEQFPLQTTSDGPFSTSDMKSIKDHIRNQHQCLVSEIAFTPAPIDAGASPSSSDKLAQRNLAIVQSANPGLVASRRVPQTFEVLPSGSREEHDELMIEWGDVPVGSVASLYMPGIDATEVLLLAARKYRLHRLRRIDQHTVKCETGGITYLPLPFTDGTLPGMLTVDLPAGIKKGQAFKVVVRQVTSGPRREPRSLLAARVAEGDGPAGAPPGPRRIVGSFQLTIPVSTKADMLPDEERLLANLRWIERAIPAADRWSDVFGQYVATVAARVDALGGDSSKVGPSPCGEGRQAYVTCRLFGLLTALLIAVLWIGTGLQAGGAVWVMGGIPAAVLLAVSVYVWRKKCRPTTCQLLGALILGSAAGAVVLGVLAALGLATPILLATLVASATAAVATAVVGWRRGCFR